MKKSVLSGIGVIIITGIGVAIQQTIANGGAEPAKLKANKALNNLAESKPVVAVRGAIAKLLQSASNDMGTTDNTTGRPTDDSTWAIPADDKDRTALTTGAEPTSALAAVAATPPGGTEMSELEARQAA